MIKNFDDVQKMSKESMDATMKSFGVFSKATQAIATEVADYSKKSFEDSTKVMEKRTAKNATEITDEVVIDVIRNYCKVMQGSIDELKAGGASDDEDNIVQMRGEIAYLDRFVPKMADEAETAAIVEAVLAAHGITDPKMAGKATGLVMKDHKGKVDPGVVAKVVKAKLGA